MIGLGPAPEKWNSRIAQEAHEQVNALRARADAHAAEEWPGKSFFRPGDWQICTPHNNMRREAKSIGMTLLSSRRTQVFSTCCLDTRSRPPLCG